MTFSVPGMDADVAQLRLLGLMKDYSRLLRSQCDRILTFRNRLQTFSLLLAAIATLGAFLIPAIQYLDDKAQTMSLIGRPYTYIMILVFLGANIILLGSRIVSSLIMMRRQWISLRSEVSRILPRFERLVSYFYQLEEQGTLQQELRLELDLCLVEAETTLLLAKDLVQYKATEPLERQEIDTIRKSALAIVKAARTAVELGRRDIKTLGRGEPLTYAKDPEGVEDYFVGRFRDEWSSKARLINEELSMRLPRQEGIHDDVLRSPKTLDDIERIAEDLEMRALKLPRANSSPGRKQKMVRLDMQSLGAVVRSAREFAERTRRRETIALLERSIEEAQHGGLSADIEQLQDWLKELQQIEQEIN